ncbi:hypothetical protein Shyhy02_53430 [Streptomyces hygroscopicus subsp. hygroscopicus]|nr:hypothetical protein Shyhy02_53430 [Streptomyces hygroscopicus subsp. hygroscopicus]
MLGAAAPGDITVLGTVALDGDGRAARYRLRGPVHAGEHLTAGGGPSAEGHRAVETSAEGHRASGTSTEDTGPRMAAHRETRRATPVCRVWPSPGLPASGPGPTGGGKGTW